MADLKLKRITGRNWMKFGALDLEFPEKGLVLVQGVNTASGGAMASVGSGKTGFGEAICRTLLGVTGRFTTAKEFSLDKSGDMYIKVEADFMGKPLIVETGFKCRELSPTGEALRYSYDGKEVQRGLIKQTREDLTRLIGVPPLLAEWTVFIDGDNLKFNKLSQAECVDLVMSALRQPPWTAYFEASKTKLGAFRRDLGNHLETHDKALKTVERAQEVLDEAHAQVKAAQTAYDTAKANHDQKVTGVKKKITARQDGITEAQKRMAEIKRELKKMEEDRAEASHQLEIKIHETEDAIDKKEKELKPLQEKRSAAWDEVTKADTAYKDYKKAADKCPTCQRPMGKIDPDRLEELRENHENKTDAYDFADGNYESGKKAVDTLAEVYRALSKQHRQISAKAEAGELSVEYENREGDVKEDNEVIQELQQELTGMAAGPSDNAIVEAKTLVRANKEYLAKAQVKVDELATLIVEDQTMEKVMIYWNKAFSPYGIPNMVLREAIKPLNNEARRVSVTMTGGTIEIRFNTVRETASGQDKAQLNIEVDNKLGDKQMAGSSKGEAGLTNFIISETLSEIGQASRRIGFRWYDEIVPHQDAKVCASIYAYMKDIADRLGVLVFLVDHNPVAANYAEHVLIVEKTGIPPNVGATVRWR
jgi:DNA repair exonuclease SbcCD ATPase subunit